MYIFFFIVIKYFLSHEFYKFFYLKFIFLIGIYYILFYSLKKVRDYFIIFLFSSIISFYTIEILFYFSSRVIIDNIKIRSSQAEKLGIDFDTRSKFQFYQDYLKQDSSAVPSIPPNDYFVNYSYLKNKSDDLYSIAGFLTGVLFSVMKVVKELFIIAIDMDLEIKIFIGTMIKSILFY